MMLTSKPSSMADISRESAIDSVKFATYDETKRFKSCSSSKWKLSVTNWETGQINWNKHWGEKKKKKLLLCCIRSCCDSSSIHTWTYYPKLSQHINDLCYRKNVGLAGHFQNEILENNFQMSNNLGRIKISGAMRLQRSFIEVEKVANKS